MQHVVSCGNRLCGVARWRRRRQSAAGSPFHLSPNDDMLGVYTEGRESSMGINGIIKWNRKLTCCQNPFPKDAFRLRISLDICFVGAEHDGVGWIKLHELIRAVNDPWQILLVPSCSIGAHPAPAPAVWESERPFYSFTLRHEMVLWVNSWSTTFTAVWSMAPANAATWDWFNSWAMVCCSVHIEICPRLLWVCSQQLVMFINCLNHGRFYLAGHRAKGCAHIPGAGAGARSSTSRSCEWQSTVYTGDHFRSHTSNSGRMWMEQIKSVYSCLFMRVRPESLVEPKPESSVLDTWQEGPAYPAFFALLMSASSQQSVISKTVWVPVQCRYNKLLITRCQEQWKQPWVRLPLLFGCSVWAVTDLSSTVALSLVRRN